MRKRTVWLAGALVLTLLIVGCSKESKGSASTEIEAADAAALTYVKGSVEGDDDLLRTVLSPEDSHYRILKEGRHFAPGAFEQIGERYAIYRYNQEVSEKGELYYKVTYYLSNHDKYFSDFLRMKKKEEEWKIHEIEGEEAEAKVPQPVEPITVHESKEE